MARQQTFGSDPGDQPTRGRGFAPLLLHTLGGASVATGIAIVAAPHVSWTLTKLVRHVTNLGFETGDLTMGGLIFSAIGFLVRASSRPRQEPRDEQVHTELAELKLLAEQQLSDARQSRSPLNLIAERINASHEAQHTVLQLVQSLQSAAAENDGKSALFRLAASLDQLTARIDERFASLTTHVNEGLQHMSHRTHESIGFVQSKLEELSKSSERHAQALEHTQSVLARVQSAPAPAPAPAPQAHAAPAKPAARRPVANANPPQPRPKPAPAPQNVVDFDDANAEFFQTLSELDAMVKESAPGGTIDFEDLDLEAQDGPLPSEPDPEDLDALLPDPPPRRPGHQG